MKTNQQFFHTLLDISNVITVVLDSEANIVFINKKGKCVLGYENENLIGVNWFDMFIPVEQRQEVRRIFSKVITGKLKSTDYHENEVLTKHGKRLLIAWHNAFIKDEKNRIVYTISSGDDITEKRAMEIALAKKNEALERALKELQETQSKIIHKERMEVVGQLSAGIAHHFNNLLTGIIGNTEIINMDPIVSSKYHRELKNIIHSCERAADLISKMLDFSSKSFAVISKINIIPLAQSVVEKLRDTLPPDIILETVFKCTECNIDIDPAKLKLILKNLIMNSIESIEERGKITVTADRIHVKNETICTMCGEKLYGKYFLIRITDTGHGIPQNIIEHIFEPFFTTKEFGKGFGLSQAFGLIEQFYGHMTVENREKQGTTISIYFPEEQITI